MASTKTTTAPKFPAPIYAETVLTHVFADGQKHFLAPLLHIHYAHCLMLAKQGLLTRAEAKAILRGLDNLNRQKMLRAKYDGSFEDLFFYVERELCDLIGEELGGKLHLARSRNDIDVTLYRMKLREEVLALLGDCLALREAIIRLASKHLNTVMPAHTHTQPAQPTTLAHYLCAALEFLSRDVTRLQAAYANVNRNPLGACAITTTGFPINRALTAQLLGFEGVVENSYYAVGGIDYLLETMSAVATAAVSLSKFNQDLLLWATQEFSFLTLNDGFVQTSSIMPQKRNPVALEHVRIQLSKAFGQAQAVMTTAHNTPFGDINDSEDPLQPLVYQTFSDARRAVRLLAGAIDAVVIDKAALREKAAGSFLTMTELADTLVRQEGVSFKLAHRLVAQTAKRMPHAQVTHEQIVTTLQDVALALTGKPLKTKKAELLAALSPEGFVQVRTVMGGPAPKQVAQFLKRQRAEARAAARWLKAKRAALAGFPAKMAQLRKQLR
jgi:argininosuccinate lyase